MRLHLCRLGKGTLGSRSPGLTPRFQRAPCRPRPIPRLLSHPDFTVSGTVSFRERSLYPVDNRSGRREKLVARSRERFATPRKEVEAKLPVGWSPTGMDGRTEAPGSWRWCDRKWRALVARQGLEPSRRVALGRAAARPDRLPAAVPGDPRSAIRTEFNSAPHPPTCPSLPIAPSWRLPLDSQSP